MNIVSSSILGLLGLFAVIGFLLGIWRGFGKSFIRIVTVFVAAIITYFVTTPITNEIFKINLSSLGINVAGVNITTMDATINAFIYKIPYIAEIMTVSPSLKEFIFKIPSLIVGLFIFILVFFAMKALIWLVYRLIARIAIAPKKKGEERNEYRLLGGIVGLVQGVFCFIVVLIPIIGGINLMSQALDIVEDNNRKTSIESVSVSRDDFSVEYISSDGAKKIVSEKEIERLKNYINPIKNNWFMKTLSFLKFDKIADGAFDKITSFEVKKTQTNLRKEVLTISKLYSNLIRISDTNVKNLDAEQIVVLDESVNIAFESVLIKNVIAESAVNISGTWIKTTNNTFAGIGRPALGGKMDNVVYSFLTAISLANADDVEKDAKAFVNVLKVANKSNQLNNMSEGGSRALNTMGDKNFLVELIDAMLGGPSLKRTIPSLIDTGLSFIYPLINVPENKTIVEENFYNKLIEANENYVDDTKLKNDYRQAFRYFDVKIVDVEPENPKFEFILNSQLDAIVVSCKDFESKEQFRQFFENNNIDFSMGKVVTQNELKVKRTSSEVNWEVEKYILADIFSGMSNTFNKTDSKEENQTAIDVLNFNEFAGVLDSIRKSQLLEGIDQALVLAFLQSSVFDGLAIGDGFMDMVKDSSKWNQVNFNVLLSALTLVQNMQEYIEDNNNSLSEKVVSDIIEVLMGDDSATKDIIIQLVDEDSLIKAGVSPDLAGAVSELIAGIKEVEDVEQSEADGQAVQNMIEAIKNSKSGGNIFENEEASDKFVDSVMSSEIVFAAIIGNANNKSFDNANENDQSLIQTSIEKYRQSNKSQNETDNQKMEEKLLLIQSKFGI